MIRPMNGPSQLCFDRDETARSRDEVELLAGQFCRRTQRCITPVRTGKHQRSESHEETDWGASRPRTYE